MTFDTDISDGLLSGLEDAGPQAVVAAYDPLGVPLTPAAAFAMTPVDIERVATTVIADMDGASVSEFLAESPRTLSGSIALDSPQAVFAIAHFNRAFQKKKLIKLSAVAEQDWSSLDALVALVVRTLDTRR